VTVPPALLSHESTEHYTPKYILDAGIACIGAINLDLCNKQKHVGIFIFLIVISTNHD